METKITDSHSRVFGPFWVNKGVSFFKNARKKFKSNLVLVQVVASGRLETTGSAVSLISFRLIFFFFIFFSLFLFLRRVCGTRN